MDFVEGIKKRLQEIEKLEKMQPCWRLGFSMMDAPKEDSYFIENGFLVKLRKGNKDAIFIPLRELDKLPLYYG